MISATNTPKKLAHATAIRTKNSNGKREFGTTNRAADRGDGGARRKAKVATLGATTTYHGTEHRYLKGYLVRIVGVIKAGGAYLTDEEELLRAGGVTADDRVEVQPWLEEEGRFSFVSSDPKATDLACFAHLA